MNYDKITEKYFVIQIEIKIKFRRFDNDPFFPTNVIVQINQRKKRASERKEDFFRSISKG